MNSSVIIAVISLVLSAISVAFSLWSFFLERNRNKCEATIHAFDDLQEKAFGCDKTSINNLSSNHAVQIVHDYISCPDDESCKEKWQNLTKSLALLEHFAVGINLNTYDLKTLNAMAGNMMIGMWAAVTPIIDYKRKGPDQKDNYIEFQTMVNTLIEYRKKQDRRH